MKAKLIACMLGMSIVFTTGTVIPAETDEASAGFVVENTAAEQPAEPPAPAPEPIPEPAPDTGTENTGAPEGGSQGSAADTSDSQNQGQNEAGNTSSGDPAASGSAETGGASSSNENGSADDSAPTDPSGVSSVVPGSETETDSSSAGIKDSSLPEETSESVSSSSLESGSEEEKEEDDEEKKELIVVAFKGIARIVLKEKKPLNEVLGMLPPVVEAVLSDGTTLHVPVDWACTSDYGDDKAEKFVFASSLKKNADGTVYDIGHPVAPGVRFPAVEIVISAEEEEKESKNDRKEPTDNKVEDAPLVMDDVTAANISAAEGEEEIFEYLIRELKLNKAAACGVLANIHYESGFNPHAIGDGGTSYGICQWHLGRYFSLVDYCGRIQLPYGSVEGQMKYLEYELAGGYAGVLDYLRQVPETEIGAYEAGYYWCYHYEMPAQILRQSTLRGNAAKNSYWPRYKDYDTTDSGKEKKDQKQLLLKELRVFEKLDGKEEVAAADSEDTESAVAPLNREAVSVSDIRKAELKQEEKDSQEAKEIQETQEEAAGRLKEEERVRRKKEEALDRLDKTGTEAVETVILEEAESIPEDTDQEEHTWDVLEPVEVDSRYFLPTRREDSLDSETFIFD